MQIIKSVSVLAWLILSSFTSNPVDHYHKIDHNSPVISVAISEKSKEHISVKMQVEKIFLYANELTDDKFELILPEIKKYFQEHVKININEIEQPLQLKSISENRLRVNIQFQIKSPTELKNLQVFSDCMDSMEDHDRMPIRINMRGISKSYRLDQSRTQIQVKF